MAGLIGNAPIYLNGVLSLFCVFVLPGLAFVSFLDIQNFPQRWFVAFLVSLAANHFLVTLIAALHFDPLATYRIAVVVLILAFVAGTMTRRYRTDATISPSGSVMRASDLGWLLLSLAGLAFTYSNVWKYGVPNVFGDGDILVSWNAWSLIWSQGHFPTSSLGYPQFIPTIWAVTYIFTGSTEQYFAFYIYIGLITLPIALSAMLVGRNGWWQPLIPGLVFIWFVAEIREPWLRSTLEQAFPDWVAAIFASCGAVLFVVNDDPDGRFDREKIVTSLTALCLVLIAAATKPLYGLFAVVILAGICTDACKHLDPKRRNRFVLGATGLLALFAILYAVNYAHLVARGMPNFPVTDLWERLSRASKLLNSNFTIPFRILLLAGLLLSPFLRRIRWLALPLYAGIWLWANTAAYDLRNVLGFLLMSAFIPLYAAAHRFLDERKIASEPRWRVPDGAVAAVLVLAIAGLTFSVAMSDNDLEAQIRRRSASHRCGDRIQSKDRGYT